MALNSLFLIYKHSSKSLCEKLVNKLKRLNISSQATVISFEDSTTMYGVLGDATDKDNFSTLVIVLRASSY